MTHFNQRISKVLTAGLLVSVALLLVGVVLTLARPEVSVGHGTAVGHIPANLAHLRPGGFFDLGLLVLLGTPVARVIAVLAGFIQRRMWLFALCSLIVLVVLGLSVYIGLEA
jgi:uncharacterized membrane protein